MKIQRGSRAVRRHISWLTGLFCLGFFLASHSPAFAQVGAPSVINYQGKLYDPSGLGGPLTGVQQVQFRIYDSLSGGTLIWGRQFPVSCTDEGIFNVLVNDGGTALAGAATNQLPGAFLGKDRYLELTVVGHGGAISPRQQLVSAPYAFQSAYAVDASSATRGFTVTGNLVLTNGSVAFHGAATIDGATTFKGAVTMTNGLTVSSAATFDGAATFHGAVTMTNGLTVSAPSVIAGYGTIPVGGIIIWSGASNAVPDGWALCTGATNNGHVTPDLRNRFVVGGGGTYAVAATGGVDTVTLTTNQIPAHSHRVQVKTRGWNAVDESSSEATTGPNNSYNHETQYFQSDSVGGGQSHENRPPYYALCYIMRVK